MITAKDKLKQFGITGKGSAKEILIDKFHHVTVTVSIPEPVHKETGYEVVSMNCLVQIDSPDFVEANFLNIMRVFETYEDELKSVEPEDLSQKVASKLIEQSLSLKRAVMGAFKVGA